MAPAFILPEVKDESKWFKGKHRFVDPETTIAGPFDHWPTRQGFDLEHTSIYALRHLRVVWSLEVVEQHRGCDNSVILARERRERERRGRQRQQVDKPRARMVGAFGLSMTRLVGAFALTGLVLRSSAVYGSIGVFFALLLWMLVIGYVLVLAAFVEVTAWAGARGTVTVSVEVPAPHA